MCTILSVSNFIGTSFRPIIFDTGFPTLNFDFGIASDGNGLRKNEENASVEREEVQKNDAVSKPSSIDDLLMPEDTEDLGGLAAKSYYGARKILSDQRDVFAYTVLPSSPTTILTPVSARRHIAYQTLGFIPSIPYPISYGIGFSGHSVYVDDEDYEPSATTEVYVQPQPMVVTYTELPVVYDPAFIRPREGTIDYTRLFEEHSDYVSPVLVDVNLPEPKTKTYSETTNPDQVYTNPMTAQTQFIERFSQLEIITDYVPIQQSAQTDYLIDIRVFDDLTTTPQFIGLSPLEVSVELVYDPAIHQKTKDIERTDSIEVHTTGEQHGNVQFNPQEFDVDQYMKLPLAVVLAHLSLNSKRQGPIIKIDYESFNVFDRINPEYNERIELKRDLPYVTDRKTEEYAISHRSLYSMPVDITANTLVTDFLTTRPILRTQETEFDAFQDYQPPKIDTYDTISDEGNAVYLPQRQVGLDIEIKGGLEDVLTYGGNVSESVSRLSFEQFEDIYESDTATIEVEEEESEISENAAPGFEGRTIDDWIATNYVPVDDMEPEIQVESYSATDKVVSIDGLADTLTQDAILIQDNETPSIDTYAEYSDGKLIIKAKSGSLELFRLGNKWKTDFETIEEQYESKVSFAYVDLETENFIGFNADEEVQPASMSKVGIMYAVLRLSMNGDINLNGMVKNTQEKREKYGTKRGMDGYDKDGEFTFLELINAMIGDSSSYAANLILDSVGVERINGILTDLGYEKTKFRGFYVGEDYVNNTTTMREMAYMMYDLLNRKNLDDDKHHNIAMDAMRKATDKVSYIDGNYDSEKTFRKHGQTRHSMGLLQRLYSGGNEGYANFISAFNLNTTKDLHDDEFRATPDYGSPLLLQFFNTILEIRKDIQKPYVFANPQP